MKGALALEDGTVFYGKVFGATGENWGEVVFNTGMTGYEGVLTDPSYCGQIVVMTYPLIGNYGINEDDFEGKRSFVRGFVVREACDRPNNWRSRETLAAFLRRENVIGLSGIDTRALTLRLRRHGTMRGVISSENLDAAQLVDKARSCPHITDEELVSQVATDTAFTVPGPGPRVVLIDLGAKLNIIRCLVKRGCEVVVVPPVATAAEILGLQPAGIVVSNGPGDPLKAVYVTGTIRALVGQKPMFGICLGHQLIALALGARTYKLKFGHRGVNHPVQDIATGRVYITSHNHGFAVAEESLADLDLEVTHRNLNDNTVEGIRHKHLPVFAVQYHPEASPGPRDAEYLFDDFVAVLGNQAGGK
ncbi:MAG: glutamine-hydrolyzing carbamoyl-phosphate synthase small subunit [Desulfotomaculales bacterium]